MSYSQNLPQWKVVFETSFFLEIELGLGKRQYTLQKKTFAYIPKPEKRQYTLQKLMTWSYIPNIDRGPYIDYKCRIYIYILYTCFY